MLEIKTSEGKVFSVDSIGDVNLDEEEVLLGGKRLTEADAQALGSLIARRHGRMGGRPRKADGEKASVSKVVRLTPDLAGGLKDAAKRQGVSESAILRESLNRFLASA